MGLLNNYAVERGMKEIKLNLGCGGRPLKGWVNVDFFDYEKNDSSRSGAQYDIKMDITSLDVSDESVDEMLLVHVVEHFTRWRTLSMFRHYFDKLRSGGKVIVEMPDLDQCIKIYLSGQSAPHMNTPIGLQNIGRTQFYGNQWDELDYETHRYVWTIEEFCTELKTLGFNIASATHDAIFHIKGRDMLVVAEKP